MLLPSASHPVWCEVHRVSHESYDPETRKFLEELKVAMEAKDMSRVVKDLGCIADKSVDLVVAVVAGKVINGG